jgi:hypothetical protein
VNSPERFALTLFLSGGFQQNCSIIWGKKTRRAAIVDPEGDLAGGPMQTFGEERRTNRWV